tara:strand:+ start:379 stop:981 length:603 start_codon:yes stop_codon:yes gene_type:complete
MTSFKYIKLLIILVISSFFLNACNGKFPGADARKFPADPKKRIEKNIAEGKGFSFNSNLGKNSGVFEFASSNELWRASLDILDFMPLASVNYSGGIIITDWYSNDKTSKESIKISIRFLSNEVRSDALDIKVFNRICVDLSNCVVSEKTGNIAPELKVKILKTAAIYKSEKKRKKIKSLNYQNKINNNKNVFLWKDIILK